MSGEIPKVKMCGFTTAEDAAAAARYGAGFLGFIFAPSPRRIEPATARRIWSDLPAGVPRVGVFRNQTAAEVRRIVDEVALDYLQFHGEETPSFCGSFGLPVIRAFSPVSVEGLQAIEDYRETAGIILVDLPKSGAGGEVLSREIASAAVDTGMRIMLAGGLDPENVAQFITGLHPFAVDVARGVESEPGRKDPAKMRKFMEQLRKGAEG